jgi:hypothetical protein
VVQSEDSPSRAGEPTLAPAMAWRPRSTWRHRGSSGPAEPGAMGADPRTPRGGRCGDRRGPVPSLDARSATGRSADRFADRGSSPAAIRLEGRAGRTHRASGAAIEARTVRIVRMRSSGVALSVDPMARTLVLEERGAANAAGRRRVELAPDARVVLSERDDQAEDLSRPFKDTVISLPDVRRGDYVVVEMRGPEGKELERSVVVTLRPHCGAGGPVATTICGGRQWTVFLPLLRGHDLKISRDGGPRAYALPVGIPVGGDRLWLRVPVCVGVLGRED